MARCCKLCPMGTRTGPTTQYFHAPLHIRAHVLLFSLSLYIVMGCALASFQTQFTERPNDPQPLTMPEGRERCRRQGDGTVGIRAMELPLLLTFLGKQARCHGAELPPPRRGPPPKFGQAPARGVPRTWHRGLAGTVPGRRTTECTYCSSSRYGAVAFLTPRSRPWRSL